MFCTLRLSSFSAFAILVLMGIAPSGWSQIRDGGIDPWNLGKGDWIYYTSQATNKLGGNVATVTNENSLMLFYQSVGVRYIVVKAATSDTLFNGSYSFPQFNSRLVNIAHANGILIFGYNRSYGQNVAGEISMADYVFNQGADGFVWDAEGEWESSNAWIGTNGPALAWQICSTVRSNWPTKFLAHGPFPIISYHSSFPYKEFGYWSDAVMPQIYPAGWSNVKSRPSGGINWTDVNWYNWQNSLAGQSSVINGQTIYWTNSIKPLAPINHAYGPNPPNSGVSEIPPEFVMEFVDYLNADPTPQTVGGYQGASFWRADLHGAAQWKNLKASTSGTFPGIVNNIVIDNPTATAVGSWASTRTFYNGTFYGNGSGTDYDSFGTNYLTISRGAGAAYVQFTPNILVAGVYDVYQWHPSLTTASTNAPHIITYNGGSATIYANQRTNAGTWSLLGRFPFAVGTAGNIRVLDNVAESSAVAVADGVKLVYVPLPTVPTGVIATPVSPSQVQVAWVNSATNATGFTIARATQPGGPYLDLSSVLASVTNYTDSGLAETTPYYYVVRATNALGSSANSPEAVAWTLAKYPVPAAITQPPETLVSLAGQNAAFTVAAIGSMPLSYQWRRNGADIAGATTTALTFPSAQASDAGTYSVRVSNPYGVALSPDAQLALTSVAALGDNSFAQSGVTTAATNMIAIAAGAWHTLGLNAGGTVVAWGDNSAGQCAVPLTLTDAVAIAAGGYHGLVIRSGGTVVGWGANDSGQTDVPAGLARVIGIAAGTWHSVALRTDGTVVAWGDNSFGQTNLPTALSNVVAVAAGGNHTLALKVDGTVIAWGENTDAEGNQAGQATVPFGLANVVAIGAGDYHSLAVKADGTVVTWGDDSQQQCDVPMGLTNVVAVAGGGAHSLALVADGTVVAWGADWNGQCDIPPGLPLAVGIAAGSYHTALLVEGILPAPQLMNPVRQGSRFNALAQTLYRKSYALEYSPSLAATNWTAISTNAGNGALRILTDPAASGWQRFYRLRQW